MQMIPIYCGVDGEEKQAFAQEQRTAGQLMQKLQKLIRRQHLIL